MSVRPSKLVSLSCRRIGLGFMGLGFMGLGVRASGIRVYGCRFYFKSSAVESELRAYSVGVGPYRKGSMCVYSLRFRG